MQKNLMLYAAALTALMLPVNARALEVSSTQPVVTQNFDAMGTDADGHYTVLPDGWRVERNMSRPREVGPWADASTSTMYYKSVSLASNQSNGTYSWGPADDATERAIGGLSTGSVGGNAGTRGVSVLTCLTNSDPQEISRFKVNYDIEKYRSGNNAAGFAVQLYYSLDGTNWTSAGADYNTYFAPDGSTGGYATVPASVTPVTGTDIILAVAPGADVYFAWNISAASGTTCSGAQGLAVDNIEIIADYTVYSSRFAYVEDVTGWSSLHLWGEGDTLGEYPGITASSSKTVNGVSYKAFEYSGMINAIFNNGTVNLPVINLDGTHDYYLCATADGVTEIADPDSYTGWVDPNFTPSGIYLRGEVNGWSPVDEWEFNDLGNGNYQLKNKTLSGAFKVADASWSASCNYGSNGSSILPDEDYALVKGTDSNISCGSNIFDLAEINLTITSEGATLRLVSNVNEDGLTTVYMMGDFNNWNYMSKAGALNLDTADGLFKGQVTLTAGSNGLSNWLIYQRLGMGGAWGVASDMTAPVASGTLTKGLKGTVASNIGTYDVTFSLASGEFTLTPVEAAIVDLSLRPAETVLLAEQPTEVKVLSLNNSLIYYNDQDQMFNEIAAAMGKNAHWTKHTLLGKPLSTHWAEGEGLAEDGNPGAKMMVRSDAWTHIILQEQSGLPRTDIETYRANVKQWIEYIRANCPNPNVVIILPMNWAYSGAWDTYTTYNAQFEANTLDVATDLGCVVCPVGKAYQAIFEAEGADVCGALYQDDRHPYAHATYLAAAMEYQLIFGEDASTITYHPSSVTDAQAAQMLQYASSTMAAFHNPVNHHASTIDFSARLLDVFGIAHAPEGIAYTVSGGGTIDANGRFTSDGTEGIFTVTATCGEFTRTATVKVAKAETEVITYPYIEINADNNTIAENFDAMATGLDLPEPWRVERNTEGPRKIGAYGTAATSVQYMGGVNLASNAKNGTWNFGNTDGSDRAVGGITTSVDNGARGINVYTHLLNTGKKKLVNATLSYDIEKYRDGNNAAGFTVQLYYSYDGRNWTSCGNDFKTVFDPSSATKGYEVVPCETASVSAVLPFDLGPGLDIYLAWNISVSSGTACAGAPALAIDNFSLTASLPAIPVAKHYIYVIDETGWDALGLYAWGDSELFGAWPGIVSAGQKTIDGRAFEVFPLDNEGGNFNLIFNNWNNGLQAPDYNIDAVRDYYFEVTPGKVTEFETETGIEETVIADTDSNPEFYTLQGVRVNPDTIAPGLYIVRRGNTVSKILIK